MTADAGAGESLAGSGALQETPASLAGLIARGEWRGAALLARAQGAELSVQDALSALWRAQDALRARRYPAARLALEDYARALAQGTDPLLETLAAQVEPGAGAAAVTALDGSQKSADPLLLDEQLAGALALPLTRAEALNARGVLMAVRGEAPLARQALEQALLADPGHYRALTNLGNLDLEVGRFAEAEAAYRRVLDLAPDYDGAHHNLGVAVRRQGRVGEGVSHIRRAQRLAMQRSREDTKAEVREQFRVNPALKNLRWLLIALVALVVFLLLRAGS